MTRTPALLALLLSGCFGTPGATTCDPIPLPDPVVTDCDDGADLDGDGLADCDDPDVDGDGLRNEWDCEPLDPDEVDVHAGGRCDDPEDREDGVLDVAEGATEIWEPANTTLADDADPGDTRLSVADGTDFSPGDEILILSQQGASAGDHEVVMVSSATATSINVEPFVALAYDSADRVRIQRVPHYDSVNVAGTLTTPGWDDRQGGGAIVFRVCGALTVTGDIDADGLGFGGGVGVVGHDGLQTTGESWSGPSVEPLAASDESEAYEVGARNAGGGGAPVGDLDELRDQNAAGAGGSYGTVGEYSYSSDGEKYAQPGEVYGSAELSAWFLGSGGGAGAPDREEDGEDQENISGSGGAGGGLVVLFARDSVTVSGGVTAKGERGDDAASQIGEVDGFPVGGEPGGGGGGSGGQVMLVSQAITVAASDDGEGVSVRWGEGGWPAGSGVVVESDVVRGGKGGYGYVRFDAETLVTEGEVNVGDDGAYEGDYSDWCWDGEDVPVYACDTDEDGDGVVAWSCGGNDCDDNDPDIFPSADEIGSDGVDQDCDGLDLCEDGTWIQGGLKSWTCATGGGRLAGLAGLFGAAVALLRRRRS